MPTRAKKRAVLKSVYATSIKNANLELRWILMKQIKDNILAAHRSQAEVAKVFQVTQPRISNLMQDKVESFSLDSLVNMLGRIGIRVVVDFEKNR